MIPSTRSCALVVAALLSSIARGDEAPPPAPTTPTPATSLSPTPEKVEEIPRPSLKLAAGLAGGAAACLLTGIALGAVAKSRESEQNGDTSNPTLYTPDLRSRGSQADTLATAAYVLFGVGGALAIADVVLWIERLRPRKRATQSARVTPTATGLMVSF